MGKALLLIFSAAILLLQNSVSGECILSDLHTAAAILHAEEISAFKSLLYYSNMQLLQLVTQPGVTQPGDLLSALPHL